MIIFAILYCCCAGYAYSSAKPTLYLYTETFPPYNYLKDKQVVGINTEIVTQVCILAALKCVIRLLPWSRALALTNKSNDAGIYSMSRNQERENSYHWVGPLVASENYLFRLKSRSDMQISDLASATKYSIAAPRNDIYEKILQERGFKNLLQLSSKFQSVKLFLAGKVDLLIASPLTLPYQLAEYDANINMLEQLMPLPVPELQGNYLALHPDIAQDYVDELQQALDTLKSSGQVDKIIMRYKTEILPH